MDICVRCLISGKVQGVFYRASTRHQAEQLGITGYAQNLQDGRVEVVACGDPANVDKLKVWLSRGPQGAIVSGVSCEVISVQNYQGFTTG
jgi:acylphosphatase